MLTAHVAPYPLPVPLPSHRVQQSELHNMEPTQLAQVLSSAWQQLRPDERSSYEAKAKAERAELEVWGQVWAGKGRQWVAACWQNMSINRQQGSHICSYRGFPSPSSRIEFSPLT